MQITEEEFLAWLENPVTQEFRKVKQERAEKIKNSLAKGTCLGNLEDYAYACGQYEEIQDILEMTYEDMLPEGKK